MVVRGAKKRIEEGKVSRRMINLSDCGELKLLTPEGIAALRDRKWTLLKHTQDLVYYDRLKKNGYSLTDMNIPVITTIHGSKGRQAPKVAVMSEMGRKCWDDTDTEHRLAYVAVTRTQNDLLISGERTVDWMTDRYDYPISQDTP
jgi:hypothetical protein